MDMHKKLLAVVACALVGIVASAFAYTLVNKYLVPNTGSINGLALYLEGVEFYNGTGIEWGPCNMSDTYYFSNFTVQNKNPIQVTVFIEPYGLPDDWQIEWQGNNTALQPNEIADGQLTLTVGASTSTWPDCGFLVKAVDET